MNKRMNTTWYTLVWSETGVTIPPLDFDPHGTCVMAFPTLESARAAAEYQTDMYGEDGYTVVPKLLSEINP